MQNRCVLVLGMHRGGTSAFAGALQILGVDFGDDLLPGQIENPLGFFEDRTVVRINDKILDAVGSFWCDPLPGLDSSEWTLHTQKLLAEATAELGVRFEHARLWGIKDPRLCRLLPLWLPLLTNLGSSPCCVITVRHPAEVVASLVARNSMEPKNAQLLWLEHLLTAEVDTRGLQRIFVTYDGLVDDWSGTVAGIAAGLQLTWPHSPAEPAVEQQITQFLRPALRHHHHLNSPIRTTRTAHEVYEIFAHLATLPAESAEAAPFLAALDEYRRLAQEWSWQHTEENIRLRRERHQAQTIIESYEADNKSLRADCSVILADRVKAQEIIEAYGNELNRLRCDLETVLQDRHLAQTVIEENQAELPRLLSDCGVLAADRALAQTVIEALETKIKELLSEREVLVTNRRQVQETLDGFDTELKALRDERAFLVEDRRLAQQALEVQAATIATLHRECEILQDCRGQQKAALEGVS